MRLPNACALAFLVLVACKGSGATTGAPSSAVIRWGDAGGAELVTEGGKVVAIPTGDLAAGAKPQVVKDETGKRLAYSTSGGKVRLVYVVGEDAGFVGPTVSAPLDFRAAPDLDGALGALFENAGSNGAQRADLVAAVAKAKGEAGIARMLADGASAPGGEWDDAFAKLPDPRKDEVRKALAPRLEKGKPTAGLARVAAIVPLRDPAKKDVLAGRVRELAESFEAPRANAVFLRALASLDKDEAAKIGCEILKKSPLDPERAKGTPEEIDHQGRESLVESSLLAIAKAGSECDKVEAALADDPCQPWVRCGSDGPVTPSQSSRQDEPLCTKEEIEKAVAAELDRAPADVLSVAKGVRPELFAYGALLRADKVPVAFATAHARRRYEVVQKPTPECDSGLAIGTPCHCDEAILRDQTCRHRESAQVSVGLCKFDVDDKAKKITNVVMTPPP